MRWFKVAGGYLSRKVQNVAFAVFVPAVPVHISPGALADPETFQPMVTETLPVGEAEMRCPK